MFRPCSIRGAGASIRDEDLKRIVRWAPSLALLDISETNVTDQGVMHIEGLSDLHTLNVSSTNVTGESEWALSRLPNLRLVVCNAREFAAATVLRLRQQRPDMVVFAQ